ncbi:MAG: ATP-dependent Clp protease ATP-binding subunit [Clostridia bacterium]
MEIRYTSDLQKVLEVAKTFSFENQINSTQLLVALATSKNTFSYEILTRLGFDSKIAKSYLVGTAIGNGEDKYYTLIMEYASKVAHFSKLSQVDTHHILLAICYYRESPPCKILSRHNIDYNVILPIINGMNYHAIYTNSEDSEIKTISISNNQEIKKEVSLPKELLENGYDLTKRASENKLSPLVGREEEIDRIIRILSRKTKNNPLLIGESGVGKTAIIEGLCQQIIEDNVPEFLKGKTIFALNINSVVSGTRYRGELEEKIKIVIDYVIEKGLILFIDEMHTIINSGNSENGMNISNILKPYLTNGDLCVIGTTTIAEYRQSIEKDKGLSRRFMVVMIEEPNKEDSYKILSRVKVSLENYHKIKIDDNTVNLCVDLSSRYITDKFLPDKAIDLLDEACAKKRNQAKNDTNDIIVNADDIYKIVAEITKIPIGQLDTVEVGKLSNIENELNSEIVGQSEAIAKLVKAIKRGRAGVSQATKPTGSFIFLGATGVGKTATAKALAKHLFGNENSLIRFDMSEYMEKNSVNKLIGAPPGYVGYDEGGMLTEQVKRKPYSIILFDEIEKAHLDVFNVLLQVLDDGRLTDNVGQTINFCNCIIIMTSNIGIKELNTGKQVGFGNSNNVEEDFTKYEAELKKSLEAKLPPEFINRIDSIIIYKYLTKDNLKEIANLFIKQLSTNVFDSRKITLKVAKSTVDYLVEMSYNIKYGARPLKRAIQDNLEDQLSDQIIKNDLHDVIVEVNINSNNQLDFLIDKGGPNANRDYEQKLLPR